MSSLDFDIDAKLMQLETEWRRAYEATMEARAEYQRLASDGRANAGVLDHARERLDRAEALTAQIMIKIERLEAHMLGPD
jgi:DNA repair ATPase RecN